MATKNSRSAEQVQDSSRINSMANDVPFDWETLPELAKNRWEEAVAFDLTVETHLAKAQASRGQAEVERQRVAGEILEATREVCHEIAADARKALESVRKKEVEAARKHLEAETALQQAEMVIARASQEANEILDRARAAAEKEAEEINQRASLQSRKVLVQVEMMKAAAQEEMETQRIYSQVARLKAESLESLSEVKLWVEELPLPTADGTGAAQQIQDPKQKIGCRTSPAWKQMVVGNPNTKAKCRTRAVRLPCGRKCARSRQYQFNRTAVQKEARPVNGRLYRAPQG